MSILFSPLEEEIFVFKLNGERLKHIYECGGKGRLSHNNHYQVYVYKLLIAFPNAGFQTFR